MLSNRFNWLALARAAWVFTNPFAFAIAVVRRRAPARVGVRTPIGRLAIELRNFESLKTLFSIFCRLDYHTDSRVAGMYVDVGANIGLASLYFLSRRSDNLAVCFEPDSGNLSFLRRNLSVFSERAVIVEHAVGATAGRAVLYRSEDGKYSSLIESERALEPEESVVDAFDDVLLQAAAPRLPVVVKLDVEGLETELVKSTRFERHAHVKRLLCESTECARWITRPHKRTVRSGYIEDLQFVA